MNNKEYYLCSLIYEQTEIFFIWYEGEPDGVVVDKQGNTITASDMETIKSAGKELNILFETEEVTVFDYDLTYNAIKREIYSEHVMNDAINLLNIFGDIALSIPDNEYNDLLDNNKPIYNKIFYGCNLPSVNTTNEKYVPVWTHEEQQVLQNLFEHGIRLIS